MSTRRGELTHRIIQSLLPWVTEQPRSADDVVLAVMAKASESNTPVTREQMVLHAYLVTMSRRYLVEMVPAEPWRLLGIEYVTEPGAGRVDVAWRHDDGRVFYDEVKTGQQPPSSRFWYEQAAKYAQHGALRHGAAFVGVRVLLLAWSESRYLVRGRLEPVLMIDPTPDNPFRPAA